MIPEQVTIHEVGPRDGLQNIAPLIATQDKIDFINRLSQTGLTHIEVTSFVSPQWIPQLADAKVVMDTVTKYPGITYSALVPNQVGLDNALGSNPDKIAFFTAASDAFTQNNLNCTIADSVHIIRKLIPAVKEQAKPIRAYISCIHTCPYTGSISPQVVAQLAKTLYEAGCQEIALGDTTGTATPRDVEAIITAVSQQIPLSAIAMHFHDTYGMAIANLYHALTLGISQFDTAIAGLGGCPYARGATGNMATEDAVYLLNGLGIAHTINLDALIETSRWFTQLHGLKNQAKLSAIGIQGDD
jgi:hydroxymethylglutaryl-CoA lyase